MTPIGKVGFSLLFLFLRDLKGDTIVAVGGDRDANVAVFSASSQTEKGVLCGMNERGLSDGMPSWSMIAWGVCVCTVS